MQRAVLTLSGVKLQRSVFRLYRGKKNKVAPIFLKMAVNCSSTSGNSEKEQFALPLMSPSLVFRSKCHRSTFCLFRIWQLTFIASYLGNLTFPKVQTILFLNTLSQTNNLLPFSRKSVLLYFFNPVQFEYLPLTFKAT